jgi:hypothetical protein
MRLRHSARSRHSPPKLQQGHREETRFTAREIVLKLSLD